MSVRQYGNWIKYRAAHAWRLTADRLEWSWSGQLPAIVVTIATMLITTFALNVWGDDSQSLKDAVIVLASGAAAFALTFAAVFAWHYWLFPYRAWLEQQESRASVHATAQRRRAHHRALAVELEECIKAAQKMSARFPFEMVSRKDAAAWYEHARSVVARVSDEERSLFETMDREPGSNRADGTGGDVKLIEGRVNKLRLIMARQYDLADRLTLAERLKGKESPHTAG